MNNQDNNYFVNISEEEYTDASSNEEQNDSSSEENTEESDDEQLKQQKLYAERLLERQKDIFNLGGNIETTVDSSSSSSDDSEDFSDNNGITLENSVELLNLDDIAENDKLDYLYKESNMSVDLFSKEVVEKEHYLVLTNGTSNANSKLSINLDRTYRNVASVKLTDAILRSKSGDSYGYASGEETNTNIPFISIIIDEFNTSFESSNSTLKSSFATLGYHVSLENSGNDATFRYYTDIGVTSPEKEFNPRITFDKITISFKQPNGTDYSFETTVNEEVFWLTFRITCLERKLKTSYLNIN